MSFSPRKYFVKKIFVQKLFQIKDARGSLLNDPLLYILYLTQNEWIWLKPSVNNHLMVLRQIMVCSSILGKNCLSLPNILWLNDPFSIIWFLALKWWDLGITFKKGSFMVHFHCSWMNYGQLKPSWPSCLCLTLILSLNDPFLVLTWLEGTTEKIDMKIEQL